MNRFFARTGRTGQSGLGLVELMIALVLSLFLLAGLLTVFLSTRRSYSDQQALSALQDNQVLAASVLTNTVRSAGYFLYSPPATISRQVAFPANGTAWAAGQVISGTGGTAGPDTLAIRLLPSPALNCLGQSGTLVQVNTLKILTATPPQSLACTATDASGGQTHALVSPLGTTGRNANGSGIENMQVLIGVGPSGGTVVQRYYAPDDMTTTDWLNARSVIATLTFYNPLFDATNTPTTATTDAQGQPRYLKMTRVIRMENLGQ